MVERSTGERNRGILRAGDHAGQVWVFLTAQMSRDGFLSPSLSTARFFVLLPLLSGLFTMAFLDGRTHVFLPGRMVSRAAHELSMAFLANEKAAVLASHS